jgi:hypothetical protein
MEHEASYFRCDILHSLLVPVCILCTGGLSYALFISLLTSKFFCTQGYMGEGEGGAGHSKFTSSRFFRCHFRAQKSLDFQGPLLPRALEMDVARIKNHYVPRHINNRYINSYSSSHMHGNLFETVAPVLSILSKEYLPLHVGLISLSPVFSPTHVAPD